MVTVPAFVWRGGSGRRGLIVGGVAGSCLGVLAWLDSGFLPAGVIVLVIVGVFYGIWIPRRMVRYWPGSKDLSGDQRVSVVRAGRRGQSVDDARLAQPVIDYTRGMHAAAETARPWRWLLVFVLVVAAATAIWDAVFGSWGNVVASAVYLAALVMELTWWPKWLQRLLADSDRAAKTAQDVLEPR